MKKSVLVLMIIIIVALICTIAFLGYTICQNNIEINNLKSNLALNEKEKNEYKITISNLESKIAELDKQAKDIDVSKYVVKELPQGIEFNKEAEGTEIVEFQNNYYVIIKAGARSSSGYSLEIKNIEINGTEVKVYVKENKPEEGYSYLTVITYPYTVLKFDFNPTVSVIFN